jgi:hypothetical protein
VFATLQTTRQVADRIEQAYRHRHPKWRPVSADPRVWMAAAAALLRSHEDDATIPVDPELFVAAQPISPLVPDPWGELTDEESVGRYRGRVRGIIHLLRLELKAEVRSAERQILLGETIESVLRTKNRKISPLGRYIVACRAERPDLADRFRTAARDQHRACPLYRHATRRLLSPGAYPVREGEPPRPLPAAAVGLGRSQFSLN